MTEKFALSPMKEYKYYMSMILMGLFFLISHSGQAQTIKGRVIDYNSLEPIPHAKIYHSDFENEDSIYCYSDINGEFFLNVGSSEEIYLQFKHYDYSGKDTSFYLEGDVVLPDILLCPMYEDCNDYESGSEFQLSVGFDFFSPEMISPEGSYKSVFGTELYSYNYNFFSTNRVHFGLKYNPVKLEWLTFRDSISMINTVSIKQQYFSVSTALDVYGRLRFGDTKNVHNPFIDLGVGYELPYLMRFNYSTDENTKTSIKGITRYNHFRTFARVGYDWYAIKLEYKLTNTLKGSFIQEPRFTFGIEFHISA